LGRSATAKKFIQYTPWQLYKPQTNSE
jgi:hypothetical protein